MAEKNTVIAVALGILVLISIVQAIQIVSLKNQVVNSIVGNVVSDNGETYEGMMARMHPDLYPSVTSKTSQVQTNPVMVGGC